MIDKTCRGVGLGLRIPHIREVIREQPPVPWFEVHICNFLGGGLNPALLEQIRAFYPLSFHGVSLNLGGVDKLNHEYLLDLKQAIEQFEPTLISEHACFTAHNNHTYHDLMPIPYTAESIKHMSERILIVQDILERQILIENVSRYHRYSDDQLSEAEFLSAVCQESDCLLLVDLNNAYVNQHNLNEDLNRFLSHLPPDRIAEVHLAGHSQSHDLLIDTHNSLISDSVWAVFDAFCNEHPDVPYLIEWDSNLPDFSTLMDEKWKADKILSLALTSNDGYF